MQELKKILIRSIPQRVWEALEALAGKHDRSLEGEARQALAAWVEPEVLGAEKSVRNKELARRLNYLLEQTNQGRSGPPKRPSHIAQAIGEESAGATEKWFLGETEPTFAQLDSIAELLGASRKWLSHGDASVYPVYRDDPPTDPQEAINWLTTWDHENTRSTERVKEIHFVRENDKDGRVAVIKISTNSNPKIYITNLQVSRENGVGGQRRLVYFALACGLLYRHFTVSKTVHVSSSIQKPEDFSSLLRGNTHPLTILLTRAECPWWEDFWDRKMFVQKNYWEDWSALCESVAATIEQDKSYSEMREKINSCALS